MSQRNKLVLNTITPVAFQVITIICGFILPRLFIQEYGSNVNGLINSITQFLAVISFLELGLGSVIQSALYGPLARNDSEKISAIITSGQKFFRRIAYILLGYIIVLMFFFPFIIEDQFEWWYTALLIFAISISTFSQYYFGIIDRLLLNADQKGYIQYTVQIVTLLINTIACIVLIRFGVSIQIVKITTSIIYLARPLVIRAYINKHYHINRKFEYAKEPITQKWNGIAQHVAFVVLDNTDTLVLTVFSSLANVSIYAVYNMIVYGIKQLLTASIGGVQALLGNLIALGEKERINAVFGALEFAIHTIVVLVFTCTGVLIVPFVMVYTKGVADINYIQPTFAVLLVCAHAFHCLRLPYNIAILAGGHYKQTQSNYIISAIINVVVSIVAVYFYGLVGVALGTLIAMGYQTIWMAIYDSKNIVNWPIKKFIKQCLVDCVEIILIILATSWITIIDITYLAWFIMAIKVFSIALVIVMTISLFLYKEQCKLIFKHFFR